MDCIVLPKGWELVFLSDDGKDKVSVGGLAPLTHSHPPPTDALLTISIGVIAVLVFLMLNQ